MSKLLILGSGSPRRRELLAELGYSFEVIKSDAEELHDADIPLRRLVEENAKIKAMDVAKSHVDRVVLGADTLVYLDEEPLGKPKSLEEAKSTLLKLSGRAHSVCTGLCLVHGERVETFSEVTSVNFKELTAEQVDDYLCKVEVMDKAGSYAIQEHGEMIIDSIEGDYSNVVGLPQQLVASKLVEFGLQTAAE